MTISKRNLTKWRKQALAQNAELCKKGPVTDMKQLHIIEISDRILLLTQELLDQHLLKEASNENTKT